jgi:hypothetical protein
MDSEHNGFAAALHASAPDLDRTEALQLYGQFVATGMRTSQLTAKAA